MARVAVTRAAQVDLHGLILRHSLPAATADRVRASTAPLATYPLLGRALEGRWAGFRVILGPWPWMLLIYRYDEAADQVTLVAIEDSRTARAATAE